VIVTRQSRPSVNCLDSAVEVDVEVADEEDWVDVRYYTVKYV